MTCSLAYAEQRMRAGALDEASQCLASLPPSAHVHCARAFGAGAEGVISYSSFIATMMPKSKQHSNMVVSYGLQRSVHR